MTTPQWNIEDGVTHCVGCDLSWGSMEETPCKCEAPAEEVQAPKQDINSIDTGTVDGILSADGMGLKKVIAESMLELHNANTPKRLATAAKRGDATAKLINSMVKLHSIDRADRRVNDLKEIREELRTLKAEIAAKSGD